MTTVRRFVETSGKDECILVSGKARGQPGLYVASVLYMKRLSHAFIPSLKQFFSTKNVAAARKQAEGWITTRLFSGHVVRRLREG